MSIQSAVNCVASVSIDVFACYYNKKIVLFCYTSQGKCLNSFIYYFKLDCFLRSPVDTSQHNIQAYPFVELNTFFNHLYTPPTLCDYQCCKLKQGEHSMIGLVIYSDN